ncbi:acylase [Sphingobium lactosutens]|uniref:penicillin acylase family protein n=1 Tax=Sphingobium lactosutens TaxID=522773 RepID=UPI0015C106F2|nr:penicillin acylase family protein [Sphingobium lactosutens]NWK96162.1 acylase [Sphingobium lactosutens]
MKYFSALSSFVALLLVAQPVLAQSEIAVWRAQAARVTIQRDDWGIAHVHGRSDADAVFGMIYAQAEDDFNRIESNYLTALGRTAEAEGEDAIWQDLRARLYMDPAKLKADYAASPAWLKKLMSAWADGLNYYLATHPQVKPRVITRFEPWMALSFTEGSIGGDIERIPLDRLKAFYGKPDGKAVAMADPDPEPRGSNGFAIAPGKSASGHALLWINPHTSFFFRSELQMTSDEGLNAYGAATWGQFFVYQGFNPTAGWMHTSSTVDAVDEFLEMVTRKPDGSMTYRYGREVRPVKASTITLSYRTVDGGQAQRSFTIYRTHHGPVIGEADGKWISFAMMDKPVPALEQSFLRTKARDYAQFVKVAERRANSSNNTIFADAKGTIAYLHPQFVPLRDDRFDYMKPVDGSDPATDWKGLTPLNRLPRLLNPASGWIQNTNNGPWSAAGKDSQSASDFPHYMDMVGENPRGEHAVMVLGAGRDFTLDTLTAAAFDRYQPAFARLIPLLAKAWDGLPQGDARKATLAGPIAALRNWDYRWSAQSVANSLACLWAEDLRQWALAETQADARTLYDHMAVAPADVHLKLLTDVVDRLDKNFGSWRTAWGDINRYQRLSGAIVQDFSDAQPSLPVPFGSARWGSLASFGARPYPRTRKWYGSSGNSFLAAVEFGKRVRARAVSVGGESGDPASRHFSDQAQAYIDGRLRPVYFHPDELAGHVERTYRPGE